MLDFIMKRITWTVGVEKPAGNLLTDGCLHYAEPNFVQYGDVGGTPLEKGLNYTYSPNFDGTNFSDTCGFLDFTLIGGLVNGMKITCIW